jgi:hypothetical protein
MNRIMRLGAATPLSDNGKKQKVLQKKLPRGAKRNSKTTLVRSARVADLSSYSTYLAHATG